MADRITLSQRKYLRKAKAAHPRAFKAAGGEIPATKSDASKMLDSIMAYCGGYRIGSTRATVCEGIRANGMSISKTVADLLPHTGNKPLTFGRNTGNGGRVPYPLPRQREILRNLIVELHREMTDADPWTPPAGAEGESGPNGALPDTPYSGNGSGDGDGSDGNSGDSGADGEAGDGSGGSGDSDSDADGENEQESDDESSDGESESESEAEAESQPEAEDKPQQTTKDFVEWVQKVVRPFCLEQNADGEAFDVPGARPALYGSRMAKAGIPLAALKSAMTLHYPQEARRELGVIDFDPTTFRKSEQIEGAHSALPYCLAVIASRTPLALIGPHGTGKTHLAWQLSLAVGEKLGIEDFPFGAISMTSGTSPSAFNGRVNPFNDEFTVSQFIRIFTGGGIYLFDEMDAADENLFLKVNMALANGEFFNDATGKMYKAHPHFIPVAGMNTMGLGADRNYTGRAKQDAAALDRWAMGRVRIELDPKLERHIANVNFDKAPLF